MADSTQQSIPFVSVEGCNKIIYLPAGVKVEYGSSLSQFTTPVLGGYYAVTSTGDSAGTVNEFYVYTGNGFSKIGESKDTGIIITNDYNFLGLVAGSTQRQFNDKISGKLQGIKLEVNQTAQELYLKDAEGTTLSTISVAFLNNEGTSFSYNATNKTLELKDDKGVVLASIPVSSFISNVGSTLELNGTTLSLKDKDGVVLSSVTLDVSNITNLQGILNGKVPKPTSLGTAATYPQVVVYNTSTGLTAYLNTSDILASIYNVDGSLTAARTLTMAGFTLTFSGIQDRSSDASYNLLMGLNAAGTIGKVNGTQALLSAANLLTDAQIDTLRVNLLKSTESFSTGQPVISSVNPPIILQNPGYTQYVSIIGSQLYIDSQSTQAQVKIVASDGTETLVNNFTTSQSNPNILTFPVTSGQLANGDYIFKIYNNGVWSAINSQAKLRVRSSITQLALPNLTWTVKDQTGAIPLNSDDPTKTSYLQLGNTIKVNAITPKLNVYGQTDQAVITPAMMNNGVLLVLDAKTELSNYFAAEYGAVKIGLSNNPVFSVSDTYTFALSWSAISYLTFLPSNYSVAFNQQVNDQIFIIISAGQITMLIKGQGKVYTQPIDMSKDLFLKLSAITVTGHQSKISLTLNSIYQLN